MSRDPCSPNARGAHKMVLDSFYTLCWVKAEPPQGSWQKYDGPTGPYLTQNYDVIIQVGLTEMKAQIGWWENVSVLPRT